MSHPSPHNQDGLELMARKGREFTMYLGLDPDSIDDCTVLLATLQRQVIPGIPDDQIGQGMILGQPADPRNLTHLHAMIRSALMTMEAQPWIPQN